MTTPALTTQPPPVHLQHYVCERRAGPDELRSRLIRRDRFLDPNNADAYFELVRNRLEPGDRVVLCLSGDILRLERFAPAA